MAWTAPRTWTDGELVTAAIMQPHVRDNLRMTMHTLARKTADETVNNSSTLQNDDHLSFSVDVSEVWLVQAWLMCDSASAADIKFGWTVPASATISWGFNSNAGGVASWAGDNLTALATTGSLNASTSAAATIQGIGLVGIVAVAGTAGTVQLQWAQVTPTVADTKVRTNSALVGCRLA